MGASWVPKDVMRQVLDHSKVFGVIFWVSWAPNGSVLGQLGGVLGPILEFFGALGVLGRFSGSFGVCPRVPVRRLGGHGEAISFHLVVSWAQNGLILMRFVTEKLCENDGHARGARRTLADDG